MAFFTQLEPKRAKVVMYLFVRDTCSTKIYNVPDLFGYDSHRCRMAGDKVHDLHLATYILILITDFDLIKIIV